MVAIIGQDSGWLDTKQQVLKDIEFLGPEAAARFGEELDKRRFEFERIKINEVNTAKLLAQVYVQGIVIRFLSEMIDRLEREKADLIEGNDRLNKMVDGKEKA